MNPSIEILGKDIEIKMSREIVNLAQYSQEDQKMVIKAGMAYDQSVSSLLHEIIEAINSDLDLKLEHRTICALESSIYQVLKSSRISLVPWSDLISQARIVMENSELRGTDA